jgi:hypothetical protein
MRTIVSNRKLCDTKASARTVAGHDSVIGSSVWLTSSVQPHTTVLLEKPNLRIRSGLPDECGRRLIIRFEAGAVSGSAFNLRCAMSTI